MPTFFAHALKLTPCPIFCTILINVLIILHTQQNQLIMTYGLTKWLLDIGEGKTTSTYNSYYNCVCDFLYSVQEMEYKYTKPLQSTPLNLKWNIWVGGCLQDKVLYHLRQSVSSYYCYKDLFHTPIISKLSKHEISIISTLPFNIFS